jgi:hypothetical protein
MSKTEQSFCFSIRDSTLDFRVPEFHTGQWVVAAVVYIVARGLLGNPASYRR